ncbi:hypothetical protein FPOAC2_04411 [Fusarium poae]
MVASCPSSSLDWLSKRALTAPLGAKGGDDGPQETWSFGDTSRMDTSIQDAVGRTPNIERVSTEGCSA